MGGRIMNRVALVTGGGRGIGRGIVLSLAGIGYDLVVNYAANEEAARQTAADAAAAGLASGRRVRVEICRADVAHSADRQQLIQFTRERFGRLDLLVNNAGVAPVVRADLLETSEESFDRLMGINLRGPFFLTQKAAHWMLEQQEAAPADYLPQIVNISSVSTYAASVNRGEYCIAKAGLAMMTKLFAARLAEHGIRVYEVRPGIIETDMTASVRERYDRLIQDGLTPIRRWGTPEDVGQAVAALAASALPFSTGEVINVDGGFHLRIL
jgi:NAD(P)-dependent dehydrogenase (short-subunit alcohol dehydrogenase family)